MRKALIVEDSKKFSRIIRSILKGYDCLIFEAATEQEAINHLSQTRFDFATVDISLDSEHPKNKDGLHFAKNLASLNETFVVLLSAVADENRESAALKSGVNKILRKQDRNFLEQLRDAYQMSGNIQMTGLSKDSILDSCFKEFVDISLSKTKEQSIGDLLFMSLQHIFPLLKHKESVPTFDEDNHIVEGIYWSRNLSSGIFLELETKPTKKENATQDTRYKNGQKQILFSETKIELTQNPTVVRVYRIPDDSFHDFSWAEMKKALES